MTVGLAPKGFGLSILIAALGLAALVVPARAQTPQTFVFSGTITNVDDDQNWFKDTLPVGAPVSGYYTFFDSGFVRQPASDPNNVSFQFFDGPNDFGAPPLATEFVINVGDRQLRRTSVFSPFGLQITIHDQYTGPFGPVGDLYTVSSPMGFPSFFNNRMCDPAIDPNCGIDPLPIMSLLFIDPSGAMLNSLDLPLVPPSLDSLSKSEGTVVISDFDGNINPYATAAFRIDRLEIIPEPATLLLLGLGASCAMFSRRRRQFPEN